MRKNPYSFSESILRSVFLSILTLLCMHASLYMVQDIFPDWLVCDPARKWIYLLVAVTAAVYEIGIRALPRFHAAGGFVMAGIYGMAAYRYTAPRKIDLEDGACAFASQFLEKYNKHFHTSYTIWKGKEELLAASFALLVLVVVLGLMILALMVQKRVILLLCPAVVLLGEMLVGYVPQWRGMALFFAAALLSMAGEWPMRRPGKRTLRAQSDGRSHNHKIQTAFLRWLPVAALVLAAAFVPAAGKAFEMPAARMMEKNPQVKSFQKKLEQNIAGLASLFWDKREEDIDNRGRDYTGREVMRVTAAKRPDGDVLLKGFCGSDYADGRWTYEQDKFEKACEQAGYTQEEAARLLLQAEYDKFADHVKLGSSGPFYSVVASDQMILQGEDDGQAAGRSDETMTDYTIAYTGIRGKNAYLPYVLDISENESSERLRLWGDASLQKPWGLDQIQVHAWKQKLNADAYYIILGMDWGAYLPQQKKSAEQKKKQELLRWYRDYVYQTYLGVPDEVAFLGQIEQWLSGLSGMTQSGYIDDYMDVPYVYGYIGQTVAQELAENLDYNLHLDPVPEGMDPLDYFVTENKQGYCVHFASTAALILRKIGIPARYVSGYVAKKAEFRPDGSGYTAIVRDWHAHAWVEIYMGGTGWVPLDVTPPNGQETPPAQSDADRGAGTQADADHTEPDEDTRADEDLSEDQKDQDEKENQSQDGQNGEAGNGQSGLWNLLLKILAALLCLLSAAWLFYTLYRMARQYAAQPVKDLWSGQYRTAVLRLNRRIYRRLCLRGKIRPRSMDDAGYEKALAAVCTDVARQEWNRYMRIVREAVFSGQEQPITKADAFFCCVIYCRLHKWRKKKAANKKNAKRHQTGTTCAKKIENK